MIAFNEYMEKRTATELIYEAAILSVELGIDPEILNEELTKVAQFVISEAGVAGSPAATVAPNSTFGGVTNAASSMWSGLGRAAQGAWTGIKDMWKGNIENQLNSAIRAVTTFHQSLGNTTTGKQQQGLIAGLIQKLSAMKAQAPQWQKERENNTRQAGQNQIQGAAAAQNPAAGQQPQQQAAPQQQAGPQRQMGFAQYAAGS